MANPFKILTILGSPQDKKSNTRALVEDFLEEVAAAGLQFEHRVIPLGRESVLPCRGCWNCTHQKPCPVSRRDDLEAIKTAMLDCDMLILACPVYTNQVTAQMKALFDRLFTWCHIFPLLGKYSLSACTTGNDGFKETGFFLEKMLATYGTSSFGTIYSTGAFASGDFPRRTMARAKNVKLARRVAETVMKDNPLPVNRMQRRMFKVMKQKLMGIHALNAIRYGNIEGQPKPPWLKMWVMKKIFKKMAVTEEQLTQWAKNISFEYTWWKRRGWLDTRSFKDLSKRPVPADLNARQLLLGDPPAQSKAS